MKYLITGRGIMRKANTIEGLMRIATDFAESELLSYKPSDKAMGKLEWSLALLTDGLGFKVMVSR